MPMRDDIDFRADVASPRLTSSATFPQLVSLRNLIISFALAERELSLTISGSKSPNSLRSFFQSMQREMAKSNADFQVRNWYPNNYESAWLR